MRARERCAPLLLALLAGCAASPPEAPEAAAPAGDVRERANAAPPQAQLLERKAGEAELDLAEYERLLVEKETRLQAAGVRIARRDAAAPAGGGFAPPPPDAAAEPAPAEEAKDEGGRTQSRPAKKRASSALGSGPAPAPRPTTPTSPAKPKAAAKGDARAESAEADADDVVAEEKAGGADRCQSICDLADTTCDLESKICELASRHAGDPRYADLCRRADEDCRAAADACQRCTP